MYSYFKSQKAIELRFRLGPFLVYRRIYLYMYIYIVIAIVCNIQYNITGCGYINQ